MIQKPSLRQISRVFGFFGLIAKPSRHHFSSGPSTRATVTRDPSFRRFQLFLKSTIPAHYSLPNVAKRPERSSL